MIGAPIRIQVIWVKVKNSDHTQTQSDTKHINQLSSEACSKSFGSLSSGPGQVVLLVLKLLSRWANKTKDRFCT